MMTLTFIQVTVLKFIHRFNASRGYMPTQKEIAENFGWASNNAVSCHIDVLVKKGALEKIANTARTFKLTDLGLAVCGAAPRPLPPHLICLPVREMRDLNFRANEGKK